MKLGMRNPARVDELYGSEVKFGYDKKLPRFMYLIDGERYRLSAVLERSRPLGLKDGAIAARLVAHSTHTWEELLRPPTGSLRNDADRAALAAKKAKKRAFALAYRKAAEEKRAYLAAKKSEHKDL